jgi:hypothetical protein
MSRHRILSALVVASLAVGAAAVGCSSSSSSGGGSQCNSDPWQCPTGQTCWPSDSNGNFACLNSAVGKNKGDACTNNIGAPTCGDGMACFAVGTPNGTCIPYCDNTKAGHGCAAGETCQPAALRLPSGGTSGTFNVCVGGEPPDAGGDTGSPPSDTGTSGDTGVAPPDGGGD